MSQDPFPLLQQPHRQTSGNTVLDSRELECSIRSSRSKSAWIRRILLTKFCSGGSGSFAGKQRIPWGTADQLNPTDILNANDFSDPF